MRRRRGGEDPWLCGPGFRRVCVGRGTVGTELGAGLNLSRQMPPSARLWKRSSRLYPVKAVITFQTSSGISTVSPIFRRARSFRPSVDKLKGSTLPQAGQVTSLGSTDTPQCLQVREVIRPLVAIMGQTRALDAMLPLGSSAIVEPLWRRMEGVAGEARTRSFATPAFAGCAFIEAWSHSRRWYRGCQPSVLLLPSPAGAAGDVAESSGG